MNNVRRGTLSIVILTALVVLGLGFAWQQAKRETSQKPKWERVTAEEARRILMENPELLSPEHPYSDFFIRLSEIGVVGIWKEMLADSDPKVRIRALREVTPEVLSAETAVPAIEPLLEDESGRVRFEAAMALLRFGSDRGAQALINQLKDPEGRMVAASLRALIRYHRRESVPVIRELFKQALDQLRAGNNEAYPAWAMYRLAEAIGVFEDHKSSPLFVRYFRLRSADALQRFDHIMVEAASRLADEQLEGVLREIFDQSEDLKVKLAAALGLAKLGDESALTFLMDQAALLRGAPKHMLTRPEVEGTVRNPAFTAWSRGKPSFGALIQAVMYLGELKAVRAIPLLTDLASSDNIPVVQAVVKSLALLGDRRVVPVLVKLTNPAHPLRYYAARALLFFDDPEAERAVRRLYKDASERARLKQEAQQLGPAEFLRQ